MYVCVPEEERRGEEKRYDVRVFTFWKRACLSVYVFMYMAGREEGEKEGGKEGRRYTDTMDQHGQIDCRLWTE